MSTGRHVVNLSGELVGTYRCVESTGVDKHDSTRIWLLRCTCGRETFMPVSRIRRYQKHNYFPRCFCEHYKAASIHQGARPRDNRPRRCSGCSSVEHAYPDCPKRKPSKICWRCCGLPHRVMGIKCLSCGLRFEREAPVELDVDGSHESSISLCSRVA